MATNRRLIPIYTTRGDIGAFLVYPYIFDPNGDWIGWVTRDQNVYSIQGQWVGLMTSDPRIIRSREVRVVDERFTPPPAPESIRIPINLPLSPQLGELAVQMIDVLDEMPELLPALDSGELREDIQ